MLLILNVCACMYLCVKYDYMFVIADLPKWLSQRQANIFAMQTAKRVQQLLWQHWWWTLCQRLLYLHQHMSKLLLGRKWSSNVGPQENHNRQWNGLNIELALLSSNYLIYIFLGSHTGFLNLLVCVRFSNWFLCVSSYIYLTVHTHSVGQVAQSV